MRLVDLIERVAIMNKESLRRHGINLHKQGLTVRQIDHLEGDPTGKNTRVVLYADTREVLGSQCYYYDRTIIDDTLWPESHRPVLKTSDVLELGLIPALLDLDDAKINKELLIRIQNLGEEANLTLKYSLLHVHGWDLGSTDVRRMDLGAYVTINSIGYYGTSGLTVVVDTKYQTRLDDILLGGTL